MIFHVGCQYKVIHVRGRQPMVRGPNVAILKKQWPFLNPKEQKKKVTKKFGKIGKKVRADGPRQKNVPNFPIFWPTYHERLATPDVGYEYKGFPCRLSWYGS